MRSHLFVPGPRGGASHGPHPVHDENLADVELVLELLGGNRHRIEETEAPVVENNERETRRHSCSEHQGLNLIELPYGP